MTSRDLKALQSNKKRQTTEKIQEPPSADFNSGKLDRIKNDVVDTAKSERMPNKSKQSFGSQNSVL